MTNKEFFLKILGEERSKFREVIDALPDDQFGHKVHDKSREAGNLAAQLAAQWGAISGVVTKGAVGMDIFEGQPTKDQMLSMFDKGMDQLIVDVQNVSDQEWENADAAMGEVWKDKKYNMAWGFLFDAIHHRGQLSTHLRAMGAKVPSIYGPSADSQM